MLRPLDQDEILKLIRIQSAKVEALDKITTGLLELAHLPDSTVDLQDLEAQLDQLKQERDFLEALKRNDNGS
jgi:hypothetical protein